VFCATQEERSFSQKATKDSATYPFLSKYAVCKVNPTEGITTMLMKPKHGKNKCQGSIKAYFETMVCYYRKRLMTTTVTFAQQTLHSTETFAICSINE